MGADRETTRLLAAWLLALRDVQAHVEVFTAFGPTATTQVARNAALMDRLQADLRAAWAAYVRHMDQPGAA